MLRSKRSRFLMVVLFLVLAGLACSFPGAQSEQEPAGQDVVATRVAATVAAGGQGEVTEGEGAVQPPTSLELPSPTDIPTVTLTPTITLTPTNTLTPTPSIPLVSVTLNTNCRYGPGMVYEYLGALLEGETAEIHGINPDGNFWYIENPDQPGGYCWITAAYAQVSGDTSQVPVLTPPPTPTNTPVPLNFNLTQPLHFFCAGQHYILFEIVNTGPQAIHSTSFHVEDLDTSVVRTDSKNAFGVAGTCPMMTKDAISSGDSGFIAIGTYAYNPLGHTMRTTAKMCSENGLGGSCVEKSSTQIVTGVSEAALKENRDPVDARAVLERLLEIPIQTWNYIAEPDALRHMGPMAGDFFEAYGLGEDDRLSAMDVQGVALASIQALHELMQEKDAQIGELEARLTTLEGQVAGQEPSRVSYASLLAGFMAGAILMAVSRWLWSSRRVKEN